MDDLNTSADEADLEMSKIETLRGEAWRVHKLINGYIRFLRSRIAGDSSRVKESCSDERMDDELGTVLSATSTLQPFSALIKEP